MADVSVREAREGDVAAIAEVQLLTWRAAYAGIVPAEVLDGLDTASVEARWRDSVAHRPDPRAHVLVALEDGQLVGLAGVVPAADDDLEPAGTAEVGPLLVLPARQRAGHGSRLLAAAVDHLRTDRFATTVSWVFEDDRTSRAFLQAAGWALDGAVRDLDLAGTVVREVRLHTDISV